MKPEHLAIGSCDKETAERIAKEMQRPDQDKLTKEQRERIRMVLETRKDV